jgi:hypothetical protein
MATIKLKDESTKTFSIDGVCYTKGDYRLQYNAKKEVLIIPKAVANISNLSGLPFKNPIAWTYFVDADDNPYGSFEEFSLAISDAINFNSGEATPQYKVYTALLYQSGTSNPSASVLENTLGTVTATRNNTGIYYLSSSAFNGLSDSNKVHVTLTNGGVIGIFLAQYIPPQSLVRINTFNLSEAATDALLNNASIEIRVYN